MKSALTKRAVQTAQLMKESCSNRSAFLKKAVQTVQFTQESFSNRSALMKRAVQTVQLTKESCSNISALMKGAVPTAHLMKESCSNVSALMKGAVRTAQLLWKELFQQFSSYKWILSAVLQLRAKMRTVTPLLLMSQLILIFEDLSLISKDTSFKSRQDWIREISSLITFMREIKQIRFRSSNFQKLLS